VCRSFHRSHSHPNSLTLASRRTGQLFNLKFTAKQLQRQSKRSEKSIDKEKLKLKKVHACEWLAGCLRVC